VDDATLRRIIADGVPGTAMSAFAQSSGGMLTDAQVNAIVQGIRSNWPSSALGGITPPSYVAHNAGSPTRGLEVYNVYCSSCHGSAGRGGTRASSIVETSYLALVSDQYLRTIVIAGWPEIGQPDWRNDVPGRPMSEQDVSDVIAWLSSQRPSTLSQSSAASSIQIGARR
jgi:mono/diheme cytochrome c family protein